MNIKRSQILLSALVVFVVVVLWEFNLLSSKGEWVCQNGKWIASGNPTDLMPIFDCRKTVNTGIAYDVYCEKNTDCACGGHVSKNLCFIGNKRYIDPTKKCNKLCLDNAKYQCVKNQCKQMK